ncbi:MAG: peptidylprolyl isomerase [Chloroflexi bacterium]|nr:peptidylprolyl isomerase [Chloroflexota bacterium]
MTGARIRATLRRISPLLLGVICAGCGTTASNPPQVPTALPPTVQPTSVAINGFRALPLPIDGLTTANTPAIVAKVDGVPLPTWLYISQVNFHLALAEGMNGGNAKPTALKAAALRTIEQQALLAVINNQIITTYGALHGFAPTATEVAAEYERVVQRRGGLQRSLQQVAQEYLTPAQDREVARASLISQRVFDDFIARKRQPVAAVSFRMVVVSNRSDALHVQHELLATNRWVSVALRVSRDPLGRSAGGEQPILFRGSGDPQLAKTVFGLTPRRISDPVHVAAGWVVVEVLHRYPAVSQYNADRVAYSTWIAGLRRQSKVWSYMPLPAGK